MLSDLSSLSAWRNFASLAIQKAPSEDSGQTARMRLSEVKFSYVVTHMLNESEKIISVPTK